MQVIDLDASACPTVKAFCAELKTIIGATYGGHGDSLESFIDSMIWGVMGDLSPPYTIRVKNVQPGPVETYARALSNAIGQARIDLAARGKPDVEVVIQVLRDRAGRWAGRQPS
jgi:hypothetical protein